MSCRMQAAYLRASEIVWSSFASTLERMLEEAMIMTSVRGMTWCWHDWMCRWATQEGFRVGCWSEKSRIETDFRFALSFP